MRGALATGLLIGGFALVCVGFYGGFSQGSSPSVLMASTAMRRARQGRIMMLCEGHFLDTATGIPEEDYSTLSHPGMLQGK